MYIELEMELEKILRQFLLSKGFQSPKVVGTVRRKDSGAQFTLHYWLKTGSTK